MVSSFGRRKEPQPIGEMGDLPSAGQVNVTVTPVLDGQALEHAYEQIRRAVAAAVRAGFADAAADPAGETAPAGQ